MVDPRKPFSSEWYTTPAAMRAPGRVGLHVRRFVSSRSRQVPDGSVLRILAVLILVVFSAFIVDPRTIAPKDPPTVTGDRLTSHVIPTARPVEPMIQTTRIDVANGSENGPLSTSGPEIDHGASVAAPVTVAEPEVEEGSLLPEHRILLLYGLPGDPSYGSLASYDNLRLLEFLQGKAEEYQQIDPGRPIILGIEIIASVAKKNPGADGDYLQDTSSATIYSYIEFTREHDMVLFLDVQIGRRTVPEDVRRLDRYLQQPHVHLGLDGQFNVRSTQLPTVDPGTITAAEIRWTQEHLAQIRTDFDLPPKVLIVHQLDEEMVINKPLLRPVRGVQLVVSASLWGDPDQKEEAYQAFVSGGHIEFGGIMISGTWDDPAMTTEDVINLPGAPDIVIYQ